MLKQFLAPPVRVDPRGIAHVVAVPLQPPDHRVFGVENHVHGPVVPRLEGPVIAHLRRAGFPAVEAKALRVEASVHAVPPVAVVRLPGDVRRLEEHVGLAVIVPHDEVDVACARFAQRVPHHGPEARRLPQRVLSCRRERRRLELVVLHPALDRVLAHEAGEVDPGSRVLRRLPGGRDRPVAAVHKRGGPGFHATALGQHRDRAPQAVRLDLRQRRGRIEGVHSARTHAAVVAHAVDVDAIVVRVRVDLELDRLALRDRDVGAEPLDAGVAIAVDVPLRGRVPLETVLGHDLVGGVHARITRHRDLQFAAGRRDSRDQENGGCGERTRAGCYGRDHGDISGPEQGVGRHPAAAFPQHAPAVGRLQRQRRLGSAQVESVQPPSPGVSRLPLSSTARLRIDTSPSVASGSHA